MLADEQYDELKASLESIHPDDIYNAFDNVPEDILEESINLLKTQGNDKLIEEHLPKEAIKNYTEALMGAIKLENKQLIIDLLCNRALAYIHNKDYDLCLEDTKLCLSIDPQNGKARYRRGLAFFEKNKHYEAKAELE